MRTILNRNILTLKQRIIAIAKLGEFLFEIEVHNDRLMAQVEVRNPWYTRENVLKQLHQIGQNLTLCNLESWMDRYQIQTHDRTLALILAGNLPLVGFHDVLCGLLTGYKLQIKVSSDDAGLTKYVMDHLIEIEPAFGEQISLVEKLGNFDVVIATGSNNSARYFEYYFGKKPHLLRKNRNSVAVLDGSESAEQLVGLGHDIFDFFGLGCRSVSKIYIPESYELSTLFEGIQQFDAVGTHQKYGNNYDYNKSIFLINREVHFDNGFVLLKEDNAFASPLAVVHFERYSTLDDVEKQLRDRRDDIQCVVSDKLMSDALPIYAFGDAQSPALDDYADNVDTIEFLITQSK